MYVLLWLSAKRRKLFNTFPKQFETKKKPANILPRHTCKAKTPINQLDCDSAIGLDLLHNSDFAVLYHDRQFSPLAKARTRFHLVALEDIFIKTQKPILCRQKNVSTLFKFYNNSSLGCGQATFFKYHLFSRWFLTRARQKRFESIFNSILQSYKIIPNIQDESDNGQSNFDICLFGKIKLFEFTIIYDYVQLLSVLYPKQNRPFFSNNLALYSFFYKETICKYSSNNAILCNQKYRLNPNFLIFGNNLQVTVSALTIQSTLDLTDLDLTDFGFNGLRILPFRKHRLLYM